MTKDDRIIEFFKKLRTRPEQVAFVIALELSGQNIEANRCKVIFENSRYNPSERAVERVRNLKPGDHGAMKRLEEGFKRVERGER